MNPTLEIALNFATIAMLLFGLFFMTLGAVGLYRMPDVYHRMHAVTKGVTLGIMGLLIASAFMLSAHEAGNPLRLITMVLLVIVFQFVANPVGAHLLSKAAHMDKTPNWAGTLSDELSEDGMLTDVCDINDHRGT